MWKYIVTTLIGSEHSLIMLTSIGILVRDLGSLEKATQSARGQLNLFVTIGICIVTVIVCLFFARYLAIHVLPGMITEDVVAKDALPDDLPKSSESNSTLD